MSSSQSQSSSDNSSNSSSSSYNTKAKPKIKKPIEKKKSRKQSSSQSEYTKRKNKKQQSLSVVKKSKFTLEPQIQVPKSKQIQNPGIIVQKIPPHNQKNYKYAMKVYVSNLPDNLNKDHLSKFLYQTLQKCNALLEPGNPITNMTHYPDKKYIFFTFRSIQQTTQCFQLDGIFYRKKSLKLKRPTDYDQNMKQKRIQGTRILPKMNLSCVKMLKCSNIVQKGFNQLFFGNFPLDLQQEDIFDILSKFGVLKAFSLVTDKQTNNSKGYGTFEYNTDAQTQQCLKRLNRTIIINQQICIKRAILMHANQVSTGILNNSTKFLNNYDQQIAYNPQLINPIQQKINVQPKSTLLFEKDLQSYYATFDINGFFKNLKISCVLLLKNIIPLSVEPQMIKKDVLSQLQRIGKVVKIVHKNLNIWIEYQKVEYSQIAYLLLLNHKYDGKNVDVSFYDPISFADNLY